jgi:hypothetical protein
VCYLTDWFSDCMKSNDFGVTTAIDSDTGRVLTTFGNNVGPFNYQIANFENRNEPERLGFLDTACYAEDHGAQPPPGFGLTQLHAMLTAPLGDIHSAARVGNPFRVLRSRK